MEKIVKALTKTVLMATALCGLAITTANASCIGIDQDGMFWWLSNNCRFDVIVRVKSDGNPAGVVTILQGRRAPSGIGSNHRISFDGCPLQDWNEGTCALK
jgi:hypothetical protein